MNFKNKKISQLLIILLSFIVVLSCTSSVKYVATNKPRPVRTGSSSEMQGMASYYGEKFHGRQTANGEIFDMYKKSAAHRTLPFGTVLQVTNMENNKSVIVKVNDRGPFKAGRILDLSFQAAKEIGMLESGVVEVKLTVLKLGSEE